MLFKAVLVVRTYNSSIQEAETGGLWIHCQAKLHSKTLSQEKCVFVAQG